MQTNVFMIQLGSDLPDYAKSIIAYDIGNNKIQPLLDDDIIDKDALKQFDDIYKHYHTGDRAFELKCFQRWFFLRDYCLKNHLTTVWHIDTDVVLFANLQSYINTSGIETTMLAEPHSGNAISGAISYWKVADLIYFCDFLTYAYTNKAEFFKTFFEKYLEKRSYGGVCDMTLLKMWACSIPHGSLLMFNNKSHLAFNDNVHTSDNYYQNEYPVDQKSGSKIFSFRRGFKTPFCENLYYQSFIPMANLHFCGGAKDSIDQMQQISLSMQ